MEQAVGYKDRHSNRNRRTPSDSSSLIGPYSHLICIPYSFNQSQLVHHKFERSRVADAEHAKNLMEKEKENCQGHIWKLSTPEAPSPGQGACPS